MSDLTMDAGLPISGWPGLGMFLFIVVFLIVANAIDTVYEKHAKASAERAKREYDRYVTSSHTLKDELDEALRQNDEKTVATKAYALWELDARYYSTSEYVSDPATHIQQGVERNQKAKEPVRPQPHGFAAIRDQIKMGMSEADVVSIAGKPETRSELDLALGNTVQHTVCAYWELRSSSPYQLVFENDNLTRIRHG